MLFQHRISTALFTNFIYNYTKKENPHVPLKLHRNSVSAAFHWKFPSGFPQNNNKIPVWFNFISVSFFSFGGSSYDRISSSTFFFHCLVYYYLRGLKSSGRTLWRTKTFLIELIVISCTNFVLWPPIVI